MAHSYLAEALLYSDKIADSIEQLSTNARIETDSDLSFSPSSLSAGQSEQIVNGKTANPETGKSIFYLIFKLFNLMCNKKLKRRDR